ncbi:MAG: ATP:cob(I)alamin adenosyltransferase [Thermoproteus sp.]
MALVKPCLLFFACPGDNGDTTVLHRGKAERATKDSPLIKFYGALDTAVAYAFKAANLLPRPQARVMRLVGFSAMELGFYIATGKAEHLDNAFELYRRALKLAYASAPEEPLRSWIACASPECSAVDEARVWIRWAERRAVSLGEAEAAKLLNQMSNLAFEVMRTLPHIEYKSRRLKP